MQHKTQGIVLSVGRYSDTYAIAHVYTRDFGRVAYLLPKKRGKKSNIKGSLFFPLSALSLDVEHLPLRDIQRLKEAERLFPLHDVCTNATKVSVAFFLSDFLVKVLREADKNELLFDFLKHSVETLEESRVGLGNFHLAFMLGLTRFLGVYPNLDNYKTGLYFDLLNGEFVQQTPLHNHYLTKAQSAYLTTFRRINYGNMHLFRMSRNDRNVILDRLLTYYRLHVCDFPPLKSLDVLRDMV